MMFLQNQLPYCETANDQCQNRESIRPVRPDNILVTQVMYICFVKEELTTLFKRTLSSGPREILNLTAVSRVQSSS